MSRYELNKLMRRIVLEPETKAQFGTDLALLLTGLDLDDDEARALRERDHVWLYAAGVHPQLLRRFYLAVWRGADAASDAYSLSIKAHGRPPFHT